MMHLANMLEKVITILLVHASCFVSPKQKQLKTVEVCIMSLPRSTIVTNILWAFSVWALSYLIPIQTLQNRFCSLLNITEEKTGWGKSLSQSTFLTLNSPAHPNLLCFSLVTFLQECRFPCDMGEVSLDLWVILGELEKFCKLCCQPVYSWELRFLGFKDQHRMIGFTLDTQLGMETTCTNLWCSKMT